LFDVSPWALGSLTDNPVGPYIPNNTLSHYHTLPILHL
jgi:hypothetical protein